MTAVPDISAAGQTQMATEAREAPAAVSRQLTANADGCRELGGRLRALAPPVAVTCARGSSDHAATFAKYLIETQLGVPTASFAPSVSSIYKSRQRMAGTLFLAISQSGHSPDLVESARAARDAGALVVALVNQVASPLADLAEVCLPLWAGPETSVAATKSFIASLASLLHVVSEWSGEAALQEALTELPDQLDQAVSMDWRDAVEPFAAAENLLVIGRGLGFGIAQEAALKFKETSRIHAEPFSAAELAHGPMALMRDGFPVLAFSQNDQTREGMRDLATALRRRGARLFMAEEGEVESGRLPVVPAMHPVAAPIAMVQSFYLLADEVARARGLDPDNPPHLKKITETL